MSPVLQLRMVSGLSSHFGLMAAPYAAVSRPLSAITRLTRHLLLYPAWNHFL